MFRNQLLFAAAISLILVSTDCTNLMPANGRQASFTGSSVFAAEPPNCPYGLEPGGGPMRCADPKDPNSYLNKQKKPFAPRQTTNNPTTKNVKSSTPSIENPPKGDNTWCRKHAKSATELDRCWRRQHGEPMPEDFHPNPNAQPGQGARYNPGGVIVPQGTTSCPSGSHRTRPENGVC